MKSVLLGFSAITLFSLSVFAQTLILKPGNQATIYQVPTTVVCADGRGHFTRYCKCATEGFVGQIVLHLVLDDEGNFDDLGNFETMAACERSLHNNPACSK